mgnify:CR=1 FL=1
MNYKLLFAFLCIFLLSGTVFADSVDERLGRIEDKLKVIEGKYETLDALANRMISFMNTYGDVISQQTQQLRSFQTKELNKVVNTVVTRTDPMYVTFPILLFFLAVFSAMAWLYGFIKSKDLIIKWVNRKNILCTCGNYAKPNAEGIYVCGKCGKKYGLV